MKRRPMIHLLWNNLQQTNRNISDNKSRLKLNERREVNPNPINNRQLTCAEMISILREIYESD